MKPTLTLYANMRMGSTYGDNHYWREPMAETLERISTLLKFASNAAIASGSISNSFAVKLTQNEAHMLFDLIDQVLDLASKNKIRIIYQEHF